MMKKRLIATSLAAVLLQQSPLFADEQPAPIDQASLKSTATGVLLGGLLGGPPGMLVGMVGGAFVAEVEGQKAEIDDLNQHLVAFQQEKASSEQLIAQRHQEYKALMVAQASQQEALETGFSFCLGFRTDSADIEPKIAAQLTSLVVMLQAFPDLNLQILAGADRRGSEGYNRALSRVRAESVAALLNQAGLPAGRITIRYLGEDAANYPLGDTEGLSFDRMVQLTLVKGDAS
jgi:outer membrane protein OmpA-like peptidoglycan-associated protein